MSVGQRQDYAGQAGELGIVVDVCAESQSAPAPSKLFYNFRVCTACISDVAFRFLMTSLVSGDTPSGPCLRGGRNDDDLVVGSHSQQRRLQASLSPLAAVEER